MNDKQNVVMGYNPHNFTSFRVIVELMAVLLLAIVTECIITGGKLW